jgi:fatty-acyl-CoA synthase
MSDDPYAEHPSRRHRSVCELLDAQAAAAPDAIAVSFPDRHHTYAEIATATIEAAQALRAAGVTHGDRVGILLREASEAYVAYALGTQRLGAISVTVNARNKVRELTYVARHSGMKLLVTNEEFRPLIEDCDLGEDCRVVYLDDGVAFGPDRAPAEEVAQAEAAVDRHDLALLIYTSGTTADPKGCLHSHATLLAEGHNCSVAIDLNAGEHFWTPLPLFHVGGWQVLLSTMTQAACFSHAGVFDATSALDQLERERVTHAFPAFELIWLGVLNHPRYEQADLSALRRIIQTGTPERLRAMQARVPQAVQISCFGMSESLGSICLGAETDPLESRTTSSGRPLEGVEVKVVDEHTTEELPRGTPGEFWFRGPTRFVGYYRDEAATAAAITPEGWYRSGDLMVHNADDTVTFQTRMKELLKVGGENVSAADIEDYLLSHPAVAVVAVVGVRDARYGEVPAAFVQLEAGATVEEQELIDYCVGKISTFKVPRYIRVVDEYPATPTQKIKKFVLRETMEEELSRLGIDEAPRIASPSSH